MRRILLLLLALLSAAGQASAQAWDAPSFFPPRGHDDIGIYAFVPEHGDWGVQGIWRQSGNIDLGVRAGFGEDVVLVGAEFFGPLQLPGSPLLLAWQAGIGGGFNDVTLLRVPVGVSAGLEVGTAGGLQLLPYAFPRLALEVASTGEDAEAETEIDLDLALDLGADLAIAPELQLRVGVTLADQAAFGVGLAYRMQRRIEVR